MWNNKLIVAGVDGSPGGRRALTWAVSEAARTGDAVQAVTAWSWDTVEAMSPVPVSPDIEQAQAERIAEAELEAVVGQLGKPVPISTEVVQGYAPRVLATAARAARLLVIGSHGHGRLRHAVLGSVSEECVRLAECPVVVVPAPHPGAGHDTSDEVVKS